VYAGVDALTGRRHHLTESVPAGPRAYAEAEKIRRRVVNQVDEQRNPRTKATVNQLTGRYLELLGVEETTHERYKQAVRIHIRPPLPPAPPLLGAFPEPRPLTTRAGQQPPASARELPVTDRRRTAKVES
jgi:hypothetical protein